MPSAIMPTGNKKSFGPTAKSKGVVLRINFSNLPPKNCRGEVVFENCDLFHRGGGPLDPSNAPAQIKSGKMTPFLSDFEDSRRKSLSIFFCFKVFFAPPHDPALNRLRCNSYRNFVNFMRRSFIPK